MELVTFQFDYGNVYCVCKQNNGPTGTSRLASLSVGLTARTYRNSVLENYAFLVYLYYMQPFYQTSTFGQNQAYCIQIFTSTECTGH